MSSGSMRDVVKALSSAFSAPTTPYPLPEDLQQTIEAFLERYHDIDEHDSHRLQDELLPLYKKYVAESPDKHGPFLSALRLLRPAIRGESRLEEWWTLVIRPTIDAIGHKRDEIEDAREFLQGILVFDADDDKDGEKARLSAHFSQRLLDAYLARTRIPTGEDDTTSPEDEFIAHEMESVLIAFGRRKPKELLLALDDLFVKKEHRAQALNLLSAFVRVQPPHLHLVLETPLIQHLEQCLMIDTSSTVIELALTVLIMFLPHITSSLTADFHLCRLCLIYSRLLCWEHFGGSKPDGQSPTADGPETTANQETDQSVEGEQTWEKLDQPFDFSESTAPGLLHYFTFLYGLFPLNFMSYIRKPRKFLKNVEFPTADDLDLDQDLIRSRTEPFRQVHLLHPNMFTTTAEDELSENRWLKSDPADVVTECMELCVAVSSSLEDPGPPPTSKLPDIPAQMVRTEDIPQGGIFILDDDGTIANDEPATSWRNTQSTMFSPLSNSQSDGTEMPRKSYYSTYSQAVGKSSKPASPVLKSRHVMDSPTLPPLPLSDLESKGPQPKKKRSQNLRRVGTINVPSSPRLENFAQALSQSQHSGSPTRDDLQSHTMASLQREIMLLRNDLNFERYLKLQHLSHIGQLQRKHIKEATVEAETQNLINTNRALKAKLAKANELYAQLKKETLTGRSQSKKWESELSSKVRSYREEQRNWHSEEDNLRLDLQKSQQDSDRLRRLVVESEARELNAKQKLRSMELDLEELETLRGEVEILQEKLQKLQESLADLDAVKKERDNLRNDLEIANMKLNSRDVERDRMRKAYERKIADLETRMQSSTPNAQPGKLPSSMQQMLDSAMAASQAKLQQMKKTHYRLLEQYTELEMRYHELEGEQKAERGRFNGRGNPNMHEPNYMADELPSPPSFRRQNSNNINNNNNNNGGGGGFGGYSSRLPRSLVTDSHEDYDYYGEYNSPISNNSPPYPARPVRLESLHQQKPFKEPINQTHDLSAAYESSLNASFKAPNAPETVISSGKSGYSVETNSSKGEKKDKIAPKSEVRVYGRGGAQNIGKKAKAKSEAKEKEKQEKASKSSGFRGLKGIM
ncbi:hypothetical protein K432DRAFT_395632 [Lepidopterella palustris CBS 459.81]|uniref:Hamartin protein-domain-containing protein n=1 Tax=Lepidopterella palustris CBS 459.81 TaxID=1314670 RepID=A0A8E2JCV9_9PEZI|nr:hypothetical protein K432DRAFT_395632 [Lepidopterella palustris CBS 459.81]